MNSKTYKIKKETHTHTYILLTAHTNIIHTEYVYDMALLQLHTIITTPTKNKHIIFFY